MSEEPAEFFSRDPELRLGGHTRSPGDGISARGRLEMSGSLQRIRIHVCVVEVGQEFIVRSTMNETCQAMLG